LCAPQAGAHCRNAGSGGAGGGNRARKPLGHPPRKATDELSIIGPFEGSPCLGSGLARWRASSKSLNLPANIESPAQDLETRGVRFFQNHREMRSVFFSGQGSVENVLSFLGAGGCPPSFPRGPGALNPPTRIFPARQHAWPLLIRAGIADQPAPAQMRNTPRAGDGGRPIAVVGSAPAMVLLYSVLDILDSGPRRSQCGPIWILVAAAGPRVAKPKINPRNCRRGPGSEIGGDRNRISSGSGARGEESSLNECHLAGCNVEGGAGQSWRGAIKTRLLEPRLEIIIRARKHPAGPGIALVLTLPCDFTRGRWNSSLANVFNAEMVEEIVELGRAPQASSPRGSR